MSILNTPLHDYIEVLDGKYGIHTDFRRWLEFEKLMKTEPLSKRYAEILKKYYISLPPKFYEAVYALCKFYAGGVMPQADKVTKGDRLYSFEQDAELIFCAFYSQYHIDLEKENLHWWKFLALLKGLDENSRFMQVLRLRGTDPDTIKDKNERRRIIALKRQYAVRDVGSHKIKDDCFAEKISMLF